MSMTYHREGPDALREGGGELRKARQKAFLRGREALNRIRPSHAGFRGSLINNTSCQQKRLYLLLKVILKSIPERWSIGEVVYMGHSLAAAQSVMLHTDAIESPFVLGRERERIREIKESSNVMSDGDTHLDTKRQKTGVTRYQSNTSKSKSTNYSNSSSKQLQLHLDRITALEAVLFTPSPALLRNNRVRFSSTAMALPPLWVPLNGVGLVAEEYRSLLKGERGTQDDNIESKADDKPSAWSGYIPPFLSSWMNAQDIPVSKQQLNLINTNISASSTSSFLNQPLPQVDQSNSLAFVYSVDIIPNLQQLYSAFRIYLDRQLELYDNEVAAAEEEIRIQNEEIRRDEEERQREEMLKKLEEDRIKAEEISRKIGEEMEKNVEEFGNKKIGGEDSVSFGEDKSYDENALGTKQVQIEIQDESESKSVVCDPLNQSKEDKPEDNVTATTKDTKTESASDPSSSPKVPSINIDEVKRNAALKHLNGTPLWISLYWRFFSDRNFVAPEGGSQGPTAPGENSKTSKESNKSSNTSSETTQSAIEAGELGAVFKKEVLLEEPPEDLLDLTELVKKEWEKKRMEELEAMAGLNTEGVSEGAVVTPGPSTIGKSSDEANQLQAIEGGNSPPPASTTRGQVLLRGSLHSPTDIHRSLSRPSDREFREQALERSEYYKWINKTGRVIEKNDEANRLKVVFAKGFGVTGKKSPDYRSPIGGSPDTKRTGTTEVLPTGTLQSPEFRSANDANEDSTHVENDEDNDSNEIFYLPSKYFKTHTRQDILSSTFSQLQEIWNELHAESGVTPSTSSSSSSSATSSLLGDQSSSSLSDNLNPFQKLVELFSKTVKTLAQSRNIHRSTKAVFDAFSTVKRAGRSLTDLELALASPDEHRERVERLKGWYGESFQFDRGLVNGILVEDCGHSFVMKDMQCGGRDSQNSQTQTNDVVVNKSSGSSSAIQRSNSPQSPQSLHSPSSPTSASRSNQQPMNLFDELPMFLSDPMTAFAHHSTTYYTLPIWNLAYKLLEEGIREKIIGGLKEFGESTPKNNSSSSKQVPEYADTLPPLIISVSEQNENKKIHMFTSLL